jgi:hypothetical protein
VRRNVVSISDPASQADAIPHGAARNRPRKALDFGSMLSPIGVVVDRDKPLPSQAEAIDRVVADSAGHTVPRRPLGATVDCQQLAGRPAYSEQIIAALIIVLERRDPPHIRRQFNRYAVGRRAASAHVEPPGTAIIPTTAASRPAQTKTIVRPKAITVAGGRACCC